MDDVATVDVSDWYLETDTISIKLIYSIQGPLGVLGSFFFFPYGFFFLE